MIFNISSYGMSHFFPRGKKPIERNSLSTTNLRNMLTVGSHYGLFVWTWWPINWKSYNYNTWHLFSSMISQTQFLLIAKCSFDYTILSTWIRRRTIGSYDLDIKIGWKLTQPMLFCKRSRLLYDTWLRELNWHIDIHFI